MIGVEGGEVVGEAAGRAGGVEGDLLDFAEIGDGGEAGVAHGFEALNLVGEGAGEASVDVEGAAAHAGDGAHVLDAGIGEFAKDHRFTGAEGVVDDTGDFDGEGLGFGAGEDGPDFADHAGAEFVEGERVGVGGRLGKESCGEDGEGAEAAEGEGEEVAHEGKGKVASRG